MTKVYGIDEAGRGPIIGPMVLACVSATPAGVEKLTNAGFKDSKQYGSGVKAQNKRADAASWLDLARKVSGSDIQAVYTVCSPNMIDYYIESYPGGLNKLERDSADELLIRVDAAVDPQNAVIFADGASLFSPMREYWPQLTAVDHGESAHVTVAAASVLAKHVRDTLMSGIEQKYLAEFGVITGGGYVNAGTRKFLDAYRAKYGELPPEARKSWGRAKQ